MATLDPNANKDIPPSPVYNAPSASDTKAASGRVTPEGSPNRDEEDDSCNFCNFSWLEKCSNVVTAFIEKVFYKLGGFIGKYPWAAILIGFAVILVPLPGLIRFHRELDGAKLWVAKNSRALDERDISETWFPVLLRVNQVLIESDQVLSAAIVQKALEIDQAIKAISVTEKGETYGFTDLCYKAGANCLQNNLLEVWGYNPTTINGLSNDDVINKVNEDPLTSSVSGLPIDVNLLLGDISKDDADKITGAKSMIMNYFISTSDLLDPEEEVLEWEKKFLEEVEKFEDQGVYRFAARSFEDIASGSIQRDLPFFMAGYVLIIVFLFVNLGKFNCSEQKIYVGAVGVFCILMSNMFASSLGSLFGQSYGPLHDILPFLLLGIGVDDMFVFSSAWENLSPDEKLLSIPEKTALMVKHAGVSILITSVTDFAAFLIGATTIIPVLRSFCIFASMGIVGVFCLTLFLFTGVFVYDQKRIAANRNACWCLSLGENYKPNECSEKSYLQLVFRKIVAKFLALLPVKIVVAVATLGFLAGGIVGTIHIEQDFDPAWFIPTGNYVDDYLQKSDQYFPNDGDDSYVYFGEIDYYDKMDTLLTLPDKLRGVEGVSGASIDFYLNSFNNWLSSSPASVSSFVDSNNRPNDANDFYEALSIYLTSDGAAYSTDVNLDTTNKVVSSSRMYFKYGQMDNSAERIKAMDKTREEVASLGFSDTDVFAYSVAYLTWEGDKIIYEELFRNIGTAFVVVLLVTFLLIANIVTVFLVLTCVVFTVINVMGFIHFWGITINTVSAINLILAIGLAVDYAAHIGHAFMSYRGSKQKRAKLSLGEIGPAVFNGGFSTFLAFFPLAFSESYLFKTFFKIFFLVSMFGLSHGLIYLPVMLSWIGPSPYNTAQHGHDHAVDDGSLLDGFTKKSPKEGAISAQNPTLEGGDIEKAGDKKEVKTQL